MGQGDQRRTTAVSYESVRAKGPCPKIPKKRSMGDGQMRASSVELPWSAHCVEISRHIRRVLISHALFGHRGMRVDLTRMLDPGSQIIWRVLQHSDETASLRNANQRAQSASSIRADQCFRTDRPRAICRTTN